MPSIIEKGAKIRLQKPQAWNLMGADDVDYIVTDLRDGCGSGTCVRVTPAVQPLHPKGLDVWYDLANFIN